MKNKRGCECCGKSFKINRESLHKGSPRRLCDRCRELRKKIKSGEGSFRNNLEQENIETSLEKESIYRRLSYTITKLTWLQEMLEEKSEAERFDKLMTLPDKKA